MTIFEMHQASPNFRLPVANGEHSQRHLVSRENQGIYNAYPRLAEGKYWARAVPAFFAYLIQHRSDWLISSTNDRGLYFDNTSSPDYIDW